jgi:hypothetical protein
MRIQVPRGLIPHHLSRPAGVSPPGFSSNASRRVWITAAGTPVGATCGIRTGVTASSATEGDALRAVAVS